MRPATQSIMPAPRSMPVMPQSMMPQSMPVMPNSVPQDGEDDHLLIPHRIEDMGDGVSRRPPQNQQKPPAWHAIEERQHLLEVELQELELHPDAPDLQPGMFESLKYFVSLHPRSEEPDHIPLPRDAPLQTVDGHYIVSQAQKPVKPGLQVGIFAGSDDERPNQNAVVTFEEMFSLRMEKLDHHLVAYVWATKSALLGSPVTTLLGRALAPLQEYQLQRRSTTWGIFDILQGHRVAEMRLKYHVCTTPAGVTDLAMADVKQTEVTVKWSPPKNDHGAPIIGYKISILLDPQPNELPEWYTLCECTKSLNPVYVVANLKGNTAYLLDVRAVNKVGAGDAGEFEIVTAPVPPDPPSKPWIEEARDGCLNVAWTPPPGDGGMPITAYRIRMRKILGASRWNPFGPGEAAASWVEMGSVGAATGQEDASMYNAWVGPLELGACEYRFQVTALNKMGEGKDQTFCQGRDAMQGELRSMVVEPQYLVVMKDDTRWLAESSLGELLNFSPKSDPFFVVPSSRDAVAASNPMTQTLQAMQPVPERRPKLPLQSSLLKRIRKAELLIMRESMEVGSAIFWPRPLGGSRCMRNTRRAMWRAAFLILGFCSVGAQEHWPSDSIGERTTERVSAGKRAGKFIACTVCEHVVQSALPKTSEVDDVRKILASEEFIEHLGDAKVFCGMKRLATLFKRLKLEVATLPDGTAELRATKSQSEPFYEEINKSELAFHWKSFAVEHACLEVFRQDADSLHSAMLTEFDKLVANNPTEREQAAAGMSCSSHLTSL
ncbi:TTN [Symbiodinium natans]|uniref:TTN protein n=1 Tax=Symbiodinium natans TaxID=878477 RepID=A0A812NET7_9DINO|nr:TTN [Symbiodinium natans]